MFGTSQTKSRHLLYLRSLLIFRNYMFQKGNNMKEAEDLITGHRRGTFAIFMFLIILLSIIVTALIVSEINEVDFEPEEKNSKLYIDDVYFLLSSSTRNSGEDVHLMVIPYITNIGTKNSGNVKVTIYAIDQETNLGVDKNTQIVGTIINETTSESELILALPGNSSYRIELLIFESDKIVLKGSGSVRLKQIGTYGEDFKSGNGNMLVSPSNTGENDDGDALGFGDKSTSICSVVVIFFIVIALGILLIQKRPNIKLKKQEYQSSIGNSYPFPPPVKNKTQEIIDEELLENSDEEMIEERNNNEKEEI